MSVATGSVESVRVARSLPLAGWARRNAWTLGLIGFLVLLLLFTRMIQPRYGVAAFQGLANSVLPLALAAAGQAVVVIAGGIDLSIGSMMALTGVVAASQMSGQGEGFGVLVVIGVILLGAILGAINGSLTVLTRVPDIVVTLAMSFVWAGFALIVLPAPGGGASEWLKNIVLESIGNEWIPKAAVVLIILVAVIWVPVARSRLGLSIYAIGGNQLAAFRSGVPVGRVKIAAYAVAGLFGALAGLSLTATTGIGTPVPGPYTLMSIAAVVLGGVRLSGGQGGIVGPIVGVVVLQLLRTDMTFLNMDTNLATVAQGVILIGVVMVGSFAQIRRGRA